MTASLLVAFTLSVLCRLRLHRASYQPISLPADPMRCSTSQLDGVSSTDGISKATTIIDKLIIYAEAYFMLY